MSKTGTHPKRKKLADEAHEAGRVIVLTGFRREELEAELAFCTADQNGGTFLVRRSELQDPDGAGDFVGRCSICRCDHWVIDLLTAYQENRIEADAVVCVDPHRLIAEEIDSLKAGSARTTIRHARKAS